MKIYVTAVEALRKKERQGETQEPPKFQPPFLDANVLFCRFFLNLTLCMSKLRVLVLSFPDVMDISIMLKISKVQSKSYSST